MPIENRQQFVEALRSAAKYWRENGGTEYFPQPDQDTPDTLIVDHGYIAPEKVSGTIQYLADMLEE